MLSQTINIRRFQFLLSLALLALLLPTHVEGQLAKTEKEFNEAFTTWRESVKAAVGAGARFRVASQAEAAKQREIWQKAVDKGNEDLLVLRPIAMRYLAQSTDPSPDLLSFCYRLSLELFDEGRYEETFEATNKILQFKPDSEGSKYLRGRCSLMLNEFEIAEDFVKNFSSTFDTLSTTELSFIDNLERTKELYQRELEIREREAKGEPLPRVELKTTKGTIVLELFENEAPDTVGNFISLVDAGYYTDKVFHRVMNGFMAQGGGFNKMAQFESVGYTIYDEMNHPDMRRHFRGVISMAKAPAPNSGSSQFFLTFVNKPELDGVHTVFGRVVSGTRAMDRLNRTVKRNDEGKEERIPGAIPDRIISAKVLQRRDHEYKPNKVGFNPR